MTKEEAKEYIEKIKDLELKIIRLEQLKLFDMTLAQVYGKLTLLESLYHQHRELSLKIKNIERLA